MSLMYPEYSSWLQRCIKERREAIIVKDEYHIVGFVILNFKVSSLKTC